MSAPPRSGVLVLDARGAAELADLAESLADGFAMIGSYQLGEPIPAAAWRPTCHAAARLVLLLGERAAYHARLVIGEKIADILTPHALAHLAELSQEDDDQAQDQPQLH